jgi:hypothetical protein
MAAGQNDPAPPPTNVGQVPQPSVTVNGTVVALLRSGDCTMS